MMDCLIRCREGAGGTGGGRKGSGWSGWISWCVRRGEIQPMIGAEPGRVACASRVSLYEAVLINNVFFPYPNYVTYMAVLLRM